MKIIFWIYLIGNVATAGVFAYQWARKRIRGRYNYAINFMTIAVLLVFGSFNLVGYSTARLIRWIRKK